MSVVAIIPARYASTRFPGKPLARATGKTLIQHVYERVRQARLLDGVVVATDDERIAAAVREFGGEAVMTRPDHASGTDRIAEVAATLSAELVLNVQGDEPEIEPAYLDQLVELMRLRPDASMATLACPFPADADPTEPSAVKLVIDRHGYALYFSRSLIPYLRDPGKTGEPAGGWLLHLGVYAYRRGFLLSYADLAPSRLEQAEKLEQLRALENGHRIVVGLVEHASLGIDTPEEYEAFVRRVTKGCCTSG
ncbi:MAG: 3-deoxy-manno-octulosonate cytidylyltransferase [Phycisphaerae bacterium]|nr:3-deoxy-manno-octulosonate cytidylyltransferase [Phycisphaerae bacterium]